MVNSTKSNRMNALADKRFSVASFPLFIITIFACTFIAASESALAANSNDPTAKIDTKIHVTRNSIRIELTEYTDDLIWIHGMESDDDGYFDKKTLTKYLNKHKEFLKTAVEVRDVNGNLLKPTLVDEGDNPFETLNDEQKLSEANLIRRKMSFTYEYRVKGKDIELMTLRHKIADANFFYPGEMSINIFQGASDLAFGCKLRIDTPLTIPFDWDSPFPSKSAPKEVIEKWLEGQASKMLGVTEFGSTYFWGYIEQRRLRVELLVPLNVIDSMIEIPAKDKYFLTAAEIPEAEKRIKSYFSKGNPVSFDGKVVKGQVQKIDFFPADQRDFAIKRELEKISFVNGRVGITIFYPYRQVPKNILAVWDKYTSAADSVEAYFFFGDKAIKKTFKEVLKDNEFLWKNTGEIKTPAPVTAIDVQPTDFQSQSNSLDSSLIFLVVAIAVICLGAIFLFIQSFQWNLGVSFLASVVLGAILFLGGRQLFPASGRQIKTDRSEEITSKILNQVYHSFEFVDKKEIYENLSKSSAGSQLTTLFLSIQDSLKVEEQGGAISKIEQVKILSCDDVKNADPKLNTGKPDQQVSTDSFRQIIEWELVGLVEHWGHSHERTNRYKAVVTVDNIDGQWKMIDLFTISQKPGSVKPRPRKYKAVQAE